MYRWHVFRQDIDSNAGNKSTCPLFCKEWTLFQMYASEYISHSILIPADMLLVTIFEASYWWFTFIMRAYMEADVVKIISCSSIVSRCYFIKLYFTKLINCLLLIEYRRTWVAAEEKRKRWSEESGQWRSHRTRCKPWSPNIPPKPSLKRWMLSNSNTKTKKQIIWQIILFKQMYC